MGSPAPPAKSDYSARGVLRAARWKVADVRRELDEIERMIDTVEDAIDDAVVHIRLAEEEAAEQESQPQGGD